MEPVIVGYLCDENGQYIVRVSGPTAPCPDMYCRDCWECVVVPTIDQSKPARTIREIYAAKKRVKASGGSS